MQAILAPVRFKELLEELKQHVFRANMDWQLYCQLYRKSPERIALLNQAAGLLFGRVQKHLLDGILMSFSRLTDPALGPRRPKKGEEPEEFNLSVELLVREVETTEREYAEQPADVAPADQNPDGVQTESSDSFGKQLRADLDAMKSDIRQLHLLRSKRLAHNDYDYKRTGKAPALDSLNYAFLDDLFKRLHMLLNRAEVFYCEAETAYGYVMTVGSGDGDYLASLLEKVFKAGDPRRVPPE